MMLESNMYIVIFRSQNKAKFLDDTLILGKYVYLACNFAGTIDACRRYAIKMNKHIKNFHGERYGKDIYFVRKVLSVKFQRRECDK